jgi:DNA-binding NarL/FixJ family response regulator
MTVIQGAGGRGLPILGAMADLAEAVLLEDHPLYREGLKAYIKTNLPEITFLYEGESFLKAKEIASKQKPKIAIVDLHLGDGRTPSEVVGFFSSLDIPVLVISAINNFESVKSAFSVGASGFVAKDSSIDEISKAIRAVLGGRQWISPTLSKALTYKTSVSEQLSAQEKKAVILYASGLKLEVVARRMDVAASTVKQYIDRAKAKFRAAGTPVSTKTDLYKVLRQEGLIE